MARASADPLGFSAVILAGPYATALQKGDKSCSSQRALTRTKWESALQDLVMIQSSWATRFDHKNNAEVRLDHIFTSIPTWLLRSCNVSSGITKAPYTLFKEGISDHADVFACFKTPSSAENKSYPIPKRVLQAPEFKRGVQEIFDKAVLSNKPPHIVLASVKEDIRSFPEKFEIIC
eukprot:8968162-Karenia_brevis.AAC.1